VTRAKKIFAWAALLGSAFALRIGLAVTSPNIFFPDEIFQTLEPAHRLVFGYGVISWEWRLGIRSWVFPTFLAGVMRATAWVSSWASNSPGTASSGYVVGTAVVLSLISLVTIWFGYAWAKRASGTPAAVIAALACSFFFGFVYFAPKALYEVVAAHVLLPGLYLGVYGEKLGERKRLFLAGFLCALAACLRIQLLPALLFAMVYFCYPRWRARIPAVAAGALVPVLFFGAVDWITWSYPWQSFILYYKENVVSGPGKELTLVQPWYWYALVLLVLLGPAVLLLFHGARRSPFLAIFCAIVVVSHSVIPHKEIRFIYPILAPAITLAAMGIVDLLDEIKAGMRFLDNPRWVVAIGVAFLFVSSALLAAHCADWYKTRWGDGAFDRLSREPALCGVGIYRAIWWESGGYTHLHRDVPIIPLGSAAQLAKDAPAINALIAPVDSSGLPSGFGQSQCWQGVCLYERPGACTAAPADEELNAYLRKIRK
jgi:GPI mannosyltransferase 3